LNDKNMSNDFAFIVKNSALLSVIESYLEGADARKMSKHSKMYISVLTVCRTVVAVPALHSLLFVPISDKNRSLYSYLCKFSGLDATESVTNALLTYLAQAVQVIVWASLHTQYKL